MDTCKTAKTLSFLRSVKDDGFTNLYNINIDECIAQIEAIKPKTCEWTYNEFDEAWDGKCGIKFVIDGDTPKENNMNFCPKCGGKLIEIKPKDNE